MPTSDSTLVKQYPHRFAEAMGTDEPAEIARRLSISYQAAKNYLEGRLPSAEVLATIAHETEYSLNWLLTGRGSKLVADESADDPHTHGEIESIVRRIVREELSRKKGAPAIEIGAKKDRKRA
jgi:transcriptional regulator with XRE-family HTH domain